ncbi:MAG TPA: FkbM family methyltransferase [Acetobacteraceae bacterium]|nr:FkbM family methyltransferase [Acetobacteraceae bacterium]
MSDPAPLGEDEIRFAYRLLLDREADPAGLAHYVAMARRIGLTPGRLREIMLASDEYRQRNRRRVQPVEVGDHVVVVDPMEPCFGVIIARYHGWEPHIAAVIGRLLTAGAVHVDVGANVGITAFRAARLVGEGGKVIAFEPDPNNAALFLRGVAANGFRHVTLFPLALSDRRAVFSLQGGSNGYLVPPEWSDLAIQAIPGDDMLDREPRVDLIKLDIEGHEPAALRGLAHTIARHRPWVLCEYNPLCLRDHAALDQAEFAAQIFAMTPAATAIEHDGRETRLGSAAELVGFWQDCNARAVAGGLLPDGVVHLDLLFRPG